MNSTSMELSIMLSMLATANMVSSDQIPAESLIVVHLVSEVSSDQIPAESLIVVHLISEHDSDAVLRTRTHSKMKLIKILISLDNILYRTKHDCSLGNISTSLIGFYAFKLSRPS